MISIFDMFAIGVGPSSSHTNGPMKASYRFLKELSKLDIINDVDRVKVHLYGSLSLTGRGHHSDKAAIKGLMGFTPETIDIVEAAKEFDRAGKDGWYSLNGVKKISYEYDRDVLFHEDFLSLHENGMILEALGNEGQVLLKLDYYSIGGGFVATAEELTVGTSTDTVEVEFPFTSAEEMMELAEENGLSIAALVLRNELSFHTLEEIEEKANTIWNVMTSCMQQGFVTEGILEGGLGLQRRAASLLKKVQANFKNSSDPMCILDWLSVYALAVSEQNAAGGQVVTSPTNGAAGVIPAVLMYHHKFVRDLDTRQILEFMAVSAAVGYLYKLNASISGAEVGCQGEIGVSTSMAAAGLCSLHGGSNQQVCIAAEIAMEHSLGMTCDPVMGLVQVPCIERNAMGAVKAVTASRMALQKCTKSIISLDTVIETMYQTGKDMNSKYRETSNGGLAVCTPTRLPHKARSGLIKNESQTSIETKCSSGGCHKLTDDW